MTGTNTDTQEQAAVARLAALEVVCPDCVLIEDKEGWGRGCQCEGTGLAPKFPGLQDQLMDACGNPECSCWIQGDGWVPVDPHEALAWLMTQPRFAWLTQLTSGDYRAAWQHGYLTGTPATKDAATPLLALIAAIEAGEG